MMITIFLFSFSWQWTDTFYSTLFYTTQGPKLLPGLVTVPTTLDTTSVAQGLYELCEDVDECILKAKNI